LPPGNAEAHRRRLTEKLTKSANELELANQKLAALARDADTRRQQAEAAAVALRKTKIELERANKKLLRSNDELRQFAYVASHDLQEPLRSITSFCGLLKAEYSERLGGSADEYIDRIINSAKRMKQLITDLLCYARVDCDEEIEFQEVSLDDIVMDAVANLQAAIDESGAEICRGDLPTVRGDRCQLVQLYQNLLANSLKYRGDVPPKILIEAGRDGDQCECSVRDNGIGIAPKHHQHVFELFRRLHGRDKYPGTGIGLALCKKLVQRHGGQISVDSELGCGSVFRFTLPAPTGQRADEPNELLTASV
jgi:light-regulated signal transduction histidine kinase (bacteriophytochrome)